MPMPSKPGRAQATLRAPSQHMDLYRARARERGMNLGDYLAMTLAESHSLEVPSYLEDKRQLKLPTSA